MKISVKVKPYSKENRLELTQKNGFIAFIKEIPAEGKANDALIELISEHFNVPKSAVRIVAGRKSRNKIIEIEK